MSFVEIEPTQNRVFVRRKRKQQCCIESDQFAVYSVSLFAAQLNTAFKDTDEFGICSISHDDKDKFFTLPAQ
jgi:hypothetical protein